VNTSAGTAFDIRRGGMKHCRRRLTDHCRSSHKRIRGVLWKRFFEMETRPMIRTVVVVGTLLLGVGAVMAQQDLVNQAQTVMKTNGKNAGALAAIVKGEKPYDQATVDAALNQFADTAKKLPTLFPASTKGLKPEGDYSASSKIWEDKAGFDEHIVSFAKVVTEAKSQIKDLETLKTTFPVVGKQCGGCHETYRVKKG
jgi:cytochrome c556